MSLSGDKGVAQLKKSVKMEHPNSDSETGTLFSNTWILVPFKAVHK